MNNDINEQQIELTEKEQARTRINLWHGSANNWINMIKELIGNSLDVFDTSKKHNIEIIIKNSNRIIYRDDGNGIPVEGKTNMGNPSYIAIFEKPFVGSKYGATSKTVGQNGIFLYSLAMTSEDINIIIGRPNGNVYNCSYHKGDRTKDLEIISKTEETFTEIEFSLDREVWDNPDFTFQEIYEIAKTQSSLGNVKIYVKDEISGQSAEFEYENGINDFFNDITKDKIFIIENEYINKIKKETFKVKDIDYEDEFDIEFIFNISNDSHDNIQKDILNTADLIQHGTIQDGVINGFRRGVEKFIKDNEKLKIDAKLINNDDIFEGLNYICNVKNNLVEYENQTKQKTSAKYYKNIIQKFIMDYLELLFLENRDLAEKICNQISINSKARINSDKARLNIQKKLCVGNKGKVKIEGLTDCKMKESTLEERILLVVEGKSAKSTVVEAYDNRIMGSLGLKGRFISCLKKTVEDVLNNEPAYTLIQALGCGIEIPYEERKEFKDIKTYDEGNLRYDCIGILTDADCFGSGIRLALLTFFYKYMPNLLKQGKIFIVVTPRYEIVMNDGKVYFPYSDREKQELIDKEVIKEEDIKSIGIKKGLNDKTSPYLLFLMSRGVVFI